MPRGRRIARVPRSMAGSLKKAPTAKKTAAPRTRRRVARIPRRK